MVEPVWRTVSDDPNSPAARAYRKVQLDASRRRASRTSRNDILVEAARGKRVLDVGCAGHAARIGQPTWLHAQLANVAREAIGIDIDVEGVEAMNAAGYRGIVASIDNAVAIRESIGSFDLVVAADVIEHLPSPQSLLALASAVLDPGGRLVVTTPNPFAPWRIRAARRHLAEDNVDHVVFAFPSGMAELADRTGLALVSYTTVGFRNPYREMRRLVGELRMYGRWRPVMRVSDFIGAVRYGAESYGETSVYVLEKHPNGR